MGNGNTVIVGCPACGGYHQAMQYDKDEITCQGSTTLKIKDRKKYQDMKDNADMELSSNPNWNEVRFTTRIDERRDTTVLHPAVKKLKGVLYTDRENRW